MPPVSSRTAHVRPSVVLRLDSLFGTYDRAIAWLAVHGPKRFSAASDADYALLIADLYGVEQGQVVHDVKMARKRERARVPRTIAERRLFYTTV